MKFMKIFALLGALAIVLLVFSFYSPEEKTGYVELQKVFQNFEGKIELEKRLQQSQWSSQLLLDSLNLQLTQLKSLPEKQQKRPQLKQEIENRQAQISNIEDQVFQIQSKKSEEFTQQIWNQINQYVQDFGAAENYDYIFGTEGAGILMYGKNEKNLTSVITKYINGKYNGK